MRAKEYAARVRNAVAEAGISLTPAWRIAKLDYRDKTTTITAAAVKDMLKEWRAEVKAKKITCPQALASSYRRLMQKWDAFYHNFSEEEQINLGIELSTMDLIVKKLLPSIHNLVRRADEATLRSDPRNTLNIRRY